MGANLRIEAAERDFFEMIAQTAFVNPFSDQRPALDAALVGHVLDSAVPGERVAELTRVVLGRLVKLEAGGKADVRRYSAKDRELMELVVLFGVYHQYCPAFDALIAEQVRSGTQSAPVSFAEEALTALIGRGIDQSEAARYFAIFFQLRRAYYFIVHGLVGESGCMREFRRRLWQNVFTQDIRVYDRFLSDRMEDFSTLLLGETGTGKGASAAAIGRSGFIPFDPRRSRFAESFMRGFVSLNLSQFPETLIESELFGHCKGAFTGAVEAHQGVLARCSAHGSIFLDEIGDVSVPVQIKLLQVLQERTYCPVGSHEPLRFRGRVIAATNHSLDELREQKLFRNDFFYRLCSDVIQVPPLRQRLQENPGELGLLTRHLLTGMFGKAPPELMDRIEGVLGKVISRDYAWPGNVRELEQAIRRILLTGHYQPSEPKQPSTLYERLVAGVKSRQLSADELVAGYCALLYEEFGTYEDVARRANLDPRTAKRYVTGKRWKKESLGKADES
jgi:DNA-binding NtrC family response regulator